jgi:hypothetical protein
MDPVVLMLKDWEKETAEKNKAMIREVILR